MHRVPLNIELDPDDADFAAVLVDATIAGRPYRLQLDTGAARTRLLADEYTCTLHPLGDHASSGFIGRGVTEPIVTITDLAIGSLRLASLDVIRRERGRDPVLGMDVLGRHRCYFRLSAGVLEIDAPPVIEPGNQLMLGTRGHVYLDARWPSATAHACWDTGAGATVVDLGFWLSHPALFKQTGVISGTDANGDQAQTPLLLMAGPLIGEHAFREHKAVAVDLTQVNATLERPMDLILGYPTIRQADWLFDFPARRWAVTR